MRSSKRYTNVAFTKRVDYDGGAHRAARAEKGPAVCRHCGAIYVKRRWIIRSDPRAQGVGAGGRPTLCRACAMIEQGLVGGVLQLDGAFLAQHQAEIERLLNTESARALEDNPLGRIIRIDRTTRGRLTVTTTTEHLVERLGRAVHRAFGGTIDYGFSHGNKFARASWRRD
jgi:hypothetical protein